MYKFEPKKNKHFQGGDGLDNYEIMIEVIYKPIREVYKQMNDYLENIITAPSTINRIIRYYAIGFQDGKPNKRFIMFGGNVVKEYELVLPSFEPKNKQL